MKLLLITGAGASRELAHEGDQMPLMETWSNILVETLDGRAGSLAAACGLQAGASGPDFEKNLGLLLQWQRTMQMLERFLPLGGPQPGSWTGEMQEFRNRTLRRLEVLMEVLNDTLYEQFGLERVDDDRAQRAYNALLDVLGSPDELALATTNYDRSAEAALAQLGHDVDTGFRSSMGRTPLLDPSRMFTGKRKPSAVPVLHLHGAVGWYAKDGKVRDHYADQPYNPTLGDPVVLYPDPLKEPTGDATVSELWRVFDDALEWADHVFVLGHSLNDPALVRALKRATTKKPVAISFFEKGGDDAIKKTLRHAIPVHVQFGPDLAFAQSPEWRARWAAAPKR